MRLSITSLCMAALLAVANAASAQYGPPSSPSLLAVPDASYQAAYNAPVRGSHAGPGASSQGYTRPVSYPGANNRMFDDPPPSDDVWADGGTAEGMGGAGAPEGAGCGAGAYEEALSCGCHDGCGARIGPMRGLGLGCGPNAWFGSLAGIYMTRDHANRFWTTYDATNPPNQILNTRQASADWRGGGQVTFGRRFGCDYGVSMTFWGTDALSGFANLRDLNNNLSTPLNLGFVNIGNVSATNFFDNAREHRIWRTNEIYNVELNFLRYTCICDTARPVQFTWLAGTRFLRFDERLIFGSVSGGNDFGSAGGTNEAYINIRDTNNLVGFQFGTIASYFVTPNVRLYATPTVGLMGNQITQRYHVYRGDGLDTMDLHARKVDFSLMAQLDLGAAWQVSNRWSVFGAYRAIGVSGIALADHQTPPFLVDAAAIQDIDSNGSLILHGAVFGAQYAW